MSTMEPPFDPKKETDTLNKRQQVIISTLNQYQQVIQQLNNEFVQNQGKLGLLKKMTIPILKEPVKGSE